MDAGWHHNDATQNRNLSPGVVVAVSSSRLGGWFCLWRHGIVGTALFRFLQLTQFRIELRDFILQQPETVRRRRCVGEPLNVVPEIRYVVTKCRQLWGRKVHRSDDFSLGRRPLWAKDRPES